MNEAEWTKFDDARVRLETAGRAHPYNVGTEFLQCIGDALAHLDELRELVTPESLDGWGDFAEAQRTYESIDFPGVSSQMGGVIGAPGVAYLKILSNVPVGGFNLSEGSRLQAAMWVTMIWRAELGGWRVHDLALDRRPLAELEHIRYSPNSAPVY